MQPIVPDRRRKRTRVHQINENFRETSWNGYPAVIRLENSGLISEVKKRLAGVLTTPNYMETSPNSEP